MFRKLILISAIFLTGSVCFASLSEQPPLQKASKLLFDSRLLEQNSDYDKFVADAGELSNLYRGTAPIEYRFSYTGTYYAYTENYEKGNVLYNGRIYKDVLLNLNAHTDELQVKIPSSQLILVLNKDFVQSFTIGVHNYINVGRKVEENKQDFSNKNINIIESVEGSSVDNIIPGGYYEIIHDGNLKLLKKTKKIYSERINQSASIETKSQVERIFTGSISYLLIKDKYIGKNLTPSGNDVVNIKRKASLISQLRSKKSEVRQFIRKNNFDSSNKDLLYSSILKYYESLSTNSIK